MKIEQINKAAYRKHLNIVIAVFVSLFAILSLMFGAILIGIFSPEIPEVVEGSQEVASNFKYNLVGVILALMLCAMLINQCKRHEFMKDVYYIWQLKQLHNRIYRRLVKIKKAAANEDEKALIILSFYYLSLKLVYELDNNTLTMSALTRDTKLLEETIAKVSHNSTQDMALLFEESMLQTM